MMNFVLAMLLYPETMRKAQAELDAVLGARLPELSDRPRAPRLEAFLLEAQRRYSISPVGARRARRALPEGVGRRRERARR